MTKLCFQVLDDLNPIFGPIQIELGSRFERDFRSKLLQALQNLWKRLKLHECNNCFFEDDDEDRMINKVMQRLFECDLCAFNRVEKYYVYAFALDGKPFWAWSKDCDAEIITWGDDSLPLAKDEPPNGGFPKDYNENPVVKLLNSLNK